MADRKTYADIFGQGKLGTTTGTKVGSGRGEDGFTYHQSTLKGGKEAKVGRTGNKTLVHTDKGYTESTGGGTPLKKGEKLKNHPEAHRVSQPRDEDGQFTYNSANKRPLSDKPSRGKTIPPFLKGIRLTYVLEADKTILDVDGKVYRAFSDDDLELTDFLTAMKSFDKWGDLNKIAISKRGKRSKLEKRLAKKHQVRATVGSGTTIEVDSETFWEYMRTKGYGEFQKKNVHKRRSFVKKKKGFKGLDGDEQVTKDNKPKTPTPPKGGGAAEQPKRKAGEDLTTGTYSRILRLMDEEDY